MSGWSNQPIVAAIVIIESVSGSGLFVYSGTPGPGTLIASISGSNVVTLDPFGNTVEPGITSYLPGISFAELYQGALTLMSLAPTTRIIQSAQLALDDAVVDSAQPGMTAAAPSTGVGSPVGAVILLGQSKDGTKPAQVLIAPAASAVPATSALLEVQGIAQITAAAAGGQVLTLQNTHSVPGNSNLELIGQAAADNMIGIMVTGDTFNRIKITTDRLLAGTGAATQDTQLYRSGVSQWSADTITADVAGSSEVWHSLGTLAGATVNKGRYRFLPDGEVKVEIDVTFGGSTAVPITFSNTLPAAYQPPGSVDVRSPASQTNAAGGVGRFFVGSAGGGAAGQVQIAALANVIGTYSAYFSYSIL